MENNPYFSNQSYSSWNVLHWYQMWRQRVVLELGFISVHSYTQPRFSDLFLLLIFVSKLENKNKYTINVHIIILVI